MVVYSAGWEVVRLIFNRLMMRRLLIPMVLAMADAGQPARRICENARPPKPVQRQTRK